MQVHGQDAAGARGHQQVGDQFGRDGHARLVFAILPGVAVKRQHRCDARRAGPPHRINHDEHLHQIMVGGRTGGLDDENVLAADIFLNFDERLAVGKGRHGAFAQFHADGSGDVPGQQRIGSAGKNLHK